MPSLGFGGAENRITAYVQPMGVHIERSIPPDVDVLAMSREQAIDLIHVLSILLDYVPTVEDNRLWLTGELGVK